VECECRLDRKASAAVPKRFASASLVDFPAEIQSRVLDWFAAPKDGMFIHGEVGTGKTHLACAIVRLFFLTRRCAHFLRAAELYTSLRDCYNRNESEANLLEKFAAYPLLVLDDIGAGNLSDFERRVTLEILDRRLNSLKPTVVTSNWDLQFISDKLDDRIASRMAGLSILELSGGDRRLVDSKHCAAQNRSKNPVPPVPVTASADGAASR
jgi:DNA replication protein DnaC